MGRKRRDPTKCANGHDIGPESGNQEVQPSGKIECRLCHRDRQRALRTRKRCRPPTEKEAADRLHHRRQGEQSIRGVDLDRYFAEMLAEENAMPWEKRRRMWPDEGEGMRQR